MRATATLRSVNFFTGLSPAKGATPAKPFQTSTGLVRGRGDQLGQFLRRTEILGVVNLGGSRFVERCEGRDVVVRVNREGVHCDTIHRSLPTKSQVNCAIRQRNSGDRCARKIDLHQHHQKVQPESRPSAQPADLPFAEPRAQLHRGAKAKEFRFHLHVCVSTTSCREHIHCSLRAKWQVFCRVIAPRGETLQYDFSQ